jgi:hypothetical protein
MKYLNLDVNLITTNDYGRHILKVYRQCHEFKSNAIPT